MKELVNGGWDYILYEDGDRLILSVPVGGAAMYEVNVVLSAEESAAFRAEGMAGLKALIRQIQLKPRTFQDRHIPLPKP